jgi:MFS family permease
VAESTTLLDPLRYRDFRVLWAGMTISLVGDGVMLVALAWLVLTLSGTPSTLAVVGVAISVPHVGLALVGGVASDRFDRRRVMIYADLARGLALLVLGALAITSQVHLWQLIALGALYGAGSAFFGPAFDATIPDLVPADLLTQANSLDQFIRPVAARLAGPMIGGFLVAAVGPGWAITANAATFALSMVCVGSLRPIGVAGDHRDRASTTADIRECYRFVRARVWLWGTLLSSAIACLCFLGPTEVLLPFLVKNDLHASASMLGVVFAFGGLGAISAALVVGLQGLPPRYISFMYCAWATSTIAVAGYGLAHFPWQLMVACFEFNLLESAGLIVWATTKQQLVPRHLLGRVSSLDWFVATGLTPISFALVGPAAAAFGTRPTMVAAGLLASAVTAGAYFLPGMRAPEVEPDELLPAGREAAW